MSKGPRGFRFAWEDRALVAACVVAAALVAVAYVFSARPRYEATAEIEIGSPSPSASHTEEGPGPILEIVSGPFLSRVLVRYALAGSPELVGGPMLTPLERVGRWLGGGRPATDEDSAVSALRSRISVRSTGVPERVLLTVRAYDARFAVLAANGLARTFVDETLAPSGAGEEDAAAWIAARVALTPDELPGADPRDPAEAATARRVLQQRLAAEQARAGTASREAMAKRRQATSARDAPESEILDRLEGAGDDTVRKTRVLLTETEARRADLEQSLGPRHPDVVTIQERLARIRTVLAGEASRVVREAEVAASAAEREAEDARRSRDALAAEVAGLPRASDASPGDAARPAETPVAVRAAASRFDRKARVVASATLPAAAASPDAVRSLEVAVISGLVLGLVLALLRSRSAS